MNLSQLIYVDDEIIKNSNNKKLLGIILNNRLGFDTHVANICNRVSKKFHALARSSQYINIQESFYCLRVWLLPIGMDVP